MKKKIPIFLEYIFFSILIISILCIIIDIALISSDSLNDNQQIISTNYDTAIIKLADDSVITVNIKVWTDCEESIEIKTTDDYVYRVSVDNCSLINNK